MTAQSERVISTPEALLFWRYIASSIDQLFTTLDGLTSPEINWSPLPNANSLYAIATHTPRASPMSSGRKAAGFTL